MANKKNLKEFVTETAEKGIKEFNIAKVTIRDYRIIARRMNLMLMVGIVSLFGLVVYLITTNIMLREEMDKRIYVQVDNQIYQAVKTDEINENVARGLTDMAFHFLFNHDQYNYEVQLERAKEFFRRKSYNYIVARFNTRSDETEGLTLFEMYQTYDARMSLEIQEMQYRSSDMMVMIEGEMRHVFEGQNPKVTPIKFMYQLERVAKTESNPYGLVIKGLKPVQ